jgi:hypothetical protein
MIATKHEFLAPTDVLERELEPKTGVVAAAVVATPLVGTWVNVDPNTRGIVKAMIAVAGSGINLHLFGACSPTPCDWGTVHGQVYANSVSTTSAVAFSALYNFNFKQTIVVGHLDGPRLTIETLDTFEDGSGRSAYYSTYAMKK